VKTAQKSEIPYEVHRSGRKTADIVIERDGRILVRAPRKVPHEQIEGIVQSKSYWIHKNLAEWRDLNATRILREYRNGEGFLYLGRSYRLLLVSGQDEALLLKNGRFCMARKLAEEQGMSAAQAAFQEYYAERGREKIPQRIRYFAPKVGVEAGKVSVQELGHRWAACSPKGNLAFHWKCLMAPPKILDYIIVHELCHFHHLDHTKAFWNELDKVMPDFRERKEWLRRYGASMDV
jgi:predicted metal-dependent hydrolase